MVSGEQLPRSVCFAVAVTALLCSSVVLWILAFGQTSMCTSDFSCTDTVCPSRCDRPGQVLLLAVPLLGVAAGVGAVVARRSGRLAYGLLPILAVAALAGVAIVAV